MSIFRTFGQEVESHDIRKLPGYSALTEETRKEIDQVYTKVYQSRQHLGMKIAEGIAYEAAKAVLTESTCATCGREKKAVRVNGGVHKFCPVCNPKSLGYGQVKRMKEDEDSEDKQKENVDDKESEEETPKKVASEVKEADEHKSYELFYGTGGHGGPYPSHEHATKRAIDMLKGSASERRIHIHPRTATGVGGYGDKVSTVEKTDEGGIKQHHYVGGTRHHTTVHEKYLGFDKLKTKLSHEKGVYDPAGLAAAIGKKKYGSKNFNTHKHMDEAEAILPHHTPADRERITKANVQASRNNGDKQKAIDAFKKLAMKEAEETASLGMDKNHPSYKAGHRFGSRLGKGFVPDPFKSFHGGSVAHMKKVAGNENLGKKLEVQRHFKQGAYDGYVKHLHEDDENSKQIQTDNKQEKCDWCEKVHAVGPCPAMQESSWGEPEDHEPGATYESEWGEPEDHEPGATYEDEIHEGEVDPDWHHRVKAGDRVTIRVPNGMGRNGQEWKEKTGKAVIHNPGQGGWALNMGGPHGTPGFANAKNLVHHKRMHEGVEAVQEMDKHALCFCGHEFGSHGKNGCKTCHREGHVSPQMVAHAFKPNANTHMEQVEGKAKCIGRTCGATFTKRPIDPDNKMSFNNRYCPSCAAAGKEKHKDAQVFVNKEEVDPMLQAAVNYISARVNVKGIMESAMPKPDLHSCDKWSNSFSSESLMEATVQTQDPSHKKTAYNKALTEHGFEYKHTDQGQYGKWHHYEHPEKGTARTFHHDSGHHAYHLKKHGEDKNWMEGKGKKSLLHWLKPR